MLQPAIKAKSSMDDTFLLIYMYNINRAIALSSTIIEHHRIFISHKLIVHCQMGKPKMS